MAKKTKMFVQSTNKQEQKQNKDMLHKNLFKSR